MKPSTLQEIQSRLEATTPGPWKAWIEGRDHWVGESFIITGFAEGEDIWGEKRGEDFSLTGATIADIDFIAHARQDIPALLAYIAELEDRLRQ